MPGFSLGNERDEEGGQKTHRARDPKFQKERSEFLKTCLELASPESVDLNVICWTFEPAVPRAIIRAAIQIVFSVRLIVLVVIRNQVIESKTIMGGDEVDRCRRFPPETVE